MRLVIVILLAVVAIGAGGVWALGQFGGNFSGGATEARAPIVREPELVAATTPVQPVTRNQTSSMQSQQPPAPPEPAVQPQSVTAEPAAPPATTPATPAPGALRSTLDETNPAALPKLATPPATADQPPAQAEARVAPATPQAELLVTTQSAPAPAATSAAVASLETQFKSRKLTYNRPPEKLALDKPIDISLIIDTTGDANAAERLKDLPGSVVERDVELSDFVSAELIGADFDIQLQTTAARQKLSPKFANEWRWRVTPTATGMHTLTLTVYGYATGSLDAEPLDSYRDNITVEVQQFDQIVTWAKGVQPVFAILAAIAAVGSAAFAFLRFREEKKQTKAMTNKSE